MVTASLQFTQSGVAGGAGQAYVGVPGSPVTVANVVNTNVISWTFSFVSVPTGSSFLPGKVQQTGATPTFVFTPDAPGSFLVTLSVTDGTNTAVDSRSFLGADTRGWLYFSHLDDDATLNYGSPPNTQGWEPGINFILKDIHDHFGGLPAAPAPQASAVTYNLVVPPSPGSAYWDVVGGDQILSFTGISANLELGQATASSLSFSATTNAVPTSATVSWSGVASGSQPVTPLGTSMSGTITGPFSSSSNGGQLAVTLTCVFPDGTHTSTQYVTWESVIVWGPQTSPGTVSITALRGQNHALRTGNAGDYAATMGAGEYMTWANPAGFTQPPTVFYGVLQVTPVLVQASVAYTNPFSVSVPMDVYTFGLAGIGAATFDVTA